MATVLAQQVSNQKLKLQAQEALDKLKLLIDHPDWVKFSQNPCLMCKMYRDNRLLARGEAIIQLPIKYILQKLSNEEIMKQLNSQLTQITMLHQIQMQGKEARVNYMRYHGIWPVQDRDFINISVKEQGEEISLIASQTSSYYYPIANKVTRAVCHIAGYALKKIDEDTTLLIYVSDVDVMGSIPQIFKNKLIERQAAMPKQIEKVLLGKSTIFQEVQSEENLDDDDDEDEDEDEDEVD